MRNSWPSSTKLADFPKNNSGACADWLAQAPFSLSKTSRGRCRRDRSPSDCNRIAWLCRAGGEVSAAAETIPYIFHCQPRLTAVKNAKAFLEKVTAVTFSTRSSGACADWLAQAPLLLFCIKLPVTALLQHQPVRAVPNQQIERTGLFQAQTPLSAQDPAPAYCAPPSRRAFTAPGIAYVIGRALVTDPS